MTPEQRARKIRKIYKIFHHQIKLASREGLNVKIDRKGWTGDLPVWQLGELDITFTLEETANG